MAMMSPRGTSSLQNVKWRFLSDAALGPRKLAQPWSDESKRRIGHLERALASTHDLEAQYQAFLQEVSKIDPSGTTYDGIGPGWAGMPANVHGAANASDMIPSDPNDESQGTFAAGGTGGAGAPAVTDGEAPAAAEIDYPAEDEEVARVQMLAAAAAASSDANAAERDSPSPVIIWRHAAPVKIATNVPADLLTDGENAARLRSRRQALQQQQPMGMAGGAGAMPTPPVNPAKAAFNRRMAYGVWYLPKEQWESRAQAAGDGLSRGHQKGGGAAGAPASAAGKAEGSAQAGKEGAGGKEAAGKGSGKAKDGKDGKGAADASADGESQSLADTIPKLYSSRIYKDFLRTQKVPNNRIPSYLQRVDSPKAQLSSRRGNIPMIDKEGGGSGADSPSVPPSRDA